MDNEKINILIVDDNPKNLQLVGNLLGMENWQIEFAESGKAALEWIDEEQFDLILLDIMMPGMDGFEVIKKIRATKSYDDVPVIFITAKNDKESIMRGFKEKAQDYICKPFDGEELLARVNTQIELRIARKKQRELNDILEKKVKERTSDLQKTYDQIVESKKKLEKSEKIKDTYLHLITNELKKPLNKALSAFQLIKEKHPDHDLKELINNVEISLAKINDFSEEAKLLSKMKEGQFNINMENNISGEIIQNSIIEVNDKSTKKSINFEIEDSIEKINITGDRDVLIHCFKLIFEVIINQCNENTKVNISAETEKRIFIKFKQIETNSLTDDMNIMLAEQIISMHSASFSKLNKDDISFYLIDFSNE